MMKRGERSHRMLLPPFHPQSTRIQKLILAPVRRRKPNWYADAGLTQRAEQAESIERMRQMEHESTEDVKPNEREETRLQEDLIATKEQLRLAEEDVRDLRRELGLAPEAFVGGLIAFVQEGDLIEVDVPARKLHVEIAPAELAKRRAGWKTPAPRYARGVMAKYANTVSTAAEGAVTT